MKNASNITATGPNIVLVGGGHAHMEALRLMAKEPLYGARVILVSDVTHATFAGMLPEVITGKVKLEDAVIDLRKICRDAGAEFVQGNVCGLNLAERFISLDRGTTISFRLLSLNIGSRPAFSDDPSVVEHAWPLKPIEIFLNRLEAFIAAHREGETKTVVVVGGGKNAFELVCSLRERLLSDVILHIVQPNERFLEDHMPATGEIAQRVLESKKIVIHLDEYVTEVNKDSIICESGLELPTDVIIWAARAEPAARWPAAAGLATDSCGFMQIRDSLQSVSHTFVFGAGEITSCGGCYYPRTARISILQGPLLYRNLKRWIEGRKLETFECSSLSRDFIFTGTAGAIVQTRKFAIDSPIAGMIRSWQNRRFMARVAG